MKVLVTGGAGFIGSHIVAQLITQGLDVLVVDDLSRGKEENVPPGAQFYPMDIRSQKCANLVIREKVDFVIHQAAQIDVQNSLQAPGFDASVNILGTLNILEACLKAGVKKVVFASSAAIYGEPCFLPVKETHPLNPQSGYGLSKQAAENYISLFKKMHALDYTILRYANVYGPGQGALGEGGVVAVFTDKLLKRETPVIFGDGEQTRDFVFVTDVARANVLALDKGSGCSVNVSTGTETSVQRIYDRLSQLLGHRGAPLYAAAKAGDIQKSCLANDLIQKVLGWQPETGIEEGLKETLEYRK